MARVLLLQAALHKQRLERTPPLGLMYLAAYLKARSHDVRIFDLRVFEDCDPERAGPVLHDFRPDLVGISSHSPESPVMFRLARMVKDLAPATPVIAGGSHATNYPEDTLVKCPSIDCAVVGEGEQTLLELVEAHAQSADLSSVAGCYYRSNGRVASSQVRKPILNLDAVPYPAWDLVNLKDYYGFPRIGIIFAHREYMILASSRGCPFDCIYCHHNLGRVYRERSAENVVEEMSELRHRYGVREIVIVDDMFNLNRARVHEICERILSRNLRLAISFPTGIRGDLLDDATLEILRRAGTYRIMFAIETASPRLQKLISKNLDFRKMEQAMKTASRLGMLLHGAVMLGLPTETEEEMRTTITYACRSPLHTVGVYRATPYKGCDLYRKARELGIPVPEESDTMSLWESTVNLSAASLDVLNRMSRNAYFLFYLDIGRLASMLRRLPNKSRMIPILVGNFVRNVLQYRVKA